MGDSHTSESEDGMLSTDSGYNFSGNSHGGSVLKKGPWTSAEDAILIDYVKKHGEGNWNAVQKHSGLARCGKSCRLRWANHLRPNLKKGAFTSEEERLIIELHAKMGNKWARMAAHLPGRTDNEIKNYWNTRIKRCHRAGLPLYPPEIYAETRPENEQPLTTGGMYGVDKGFHDILQTTGYKTPNAMFASFNILPYPPEFSETPANGLMVNGFGCPQFHNFVSNTIGLEKHSLDPDELMSDYGGEYGRDSANEAPLCDRTHADTCENKMYQSFSPCFPLDPEHTRKPFPFGVSKDIHFMSDAHISASEHFASAQKLELPSFQYQDTSLCALDSAPKLLDYSVQYPLSGSPTSHRPSRQNSGLLEDLLYEAEALSKLENQYSDMTDRSALKPCSTGYKGFLDSSSPSNSIGTMFDGCTPSGTVGRSLEEEIPVLHVKSEAFDGSYILESERKENLDHLDFSRPDALLGSSWVQKRGPVNDAIAALLGYDLGTDLKNTSASASSRGLSSCTWNNMPAVYHMSEPPRTFPK